MEIGAFGIVAAVVFFILMIGVAMVVFSMIRRTVKLAFRLLIVGLLLLIAVVGAASLWWFSGANTPSKTSPANSRQAR
jgi:protein-S-isoprenylcysteine O-methyltransferase Ste14